MRVKGLQMKHHNVLVVKGFDLFFKDASWLQMQAIAEDLGKRGSFEFIEQRATYMFEYDRMIAVQDLKSLHQTVKATGVNLAKKHGCSYEANELYLNATHANLQKIKKQVSVVSVKKCT